MKVYLLLLSFFLSTISIGQAGPKGKYINDAINENNYLIFNSDSSFKYRFSYHIMHDISCGNFKMSGDTIYLFYQTDLRDTDCNREIDAITHYDTSVLIMRRQKLLFKNDKLYEFEDGKVIKKRRTQLSFKPPKAWGYRRKYLLFGPFVKTYKDTYYMITETKVKWRSTRKTATKN
jgi:hypothetical protein